MEDWMEREIAVTRSKSGILILCDPYDNLISTGISPWPPPEIVQKLYKGRWELENQKDDNCVLSSFDYNCDLKSINSEDAITWSVFGTVAHAPPEVRSQWLKDFFALLDLPTDGTEKSHLFLWRRIPHPITKVMSGPEVDLAIITEETVLICEMKWNSQASIHKTDEGNFDQLQLRQKFIDRLGPAIFPNQEIREVGLVYRRETEIGDVLEKNPSLKFTTWDKVCSIKSHPLPAEVECYYSWKSGLSSPPGRNPGKR